MGLFEFTGAEFLPLNVYKTSKCLSSNSVLEQMLSILDI